ncbi:V-type proton ATPase subunit a2 [Portunus trituberculatus]|uniref:V-type proton ATPase subunit a2 n=1 Tax=Portunus trituberculatus TaxID=210409 RepID=A0A5B7JZA2_PORTR|nr:V-type proton ATPase subunit a2 [Portunus trituberculatus]
MYDNQFTIQLILLVVALLCVPIMLIPKPFIARRQHNQRMRQLAVSRQLLETQVRPECLSTCVDLLVSEFDPQCQLACCGKLMI